MTQRQEEERFLEVAALLPPRLRQGLEGLSGTETAQVEELRLLTGRDLTVVGPWGERVPSGCRGMTVESCDLMLTLEVATRASAHTALEQVRSGFVTVGGGHRIGICGSAVMENGAVRNLKQVSSLSIRVARQVLGISAPVLARLTARGRLESTLILSPPGGGKTTLLRDLIRAVSNGEGAQPMRVGVADERGELAGMYQGRAQMEVGAHTDVMDGCPKGVALLMLLRGMNPQVLAADEITAPEDCAALEMAANCGVTLLATAHGERLEDLRERRLYRELLDKGIFRRLVTVSAKSGRRLYEVTSLEGESC